MLLPEQERFPEHKALLPAAGSREAARADALLRLERRLFSDWLGWLCQAWCVGLQPDTEAEPPVLGWGTAVRGCAEAGHSLHKYLGRGLPGVSLLAKPRCCVSLRVTERL